MSKTPEYWADPIIVPKGSCKLEWLRDPRKQKPQRKRGTAAHSKL
jgi:hypothetical protein